MQKEGRRWVDDIKEILLDLGLTWEGTMELAIDRRWWKDVMGEGIERREIILERISWGFRV